MVASQLCAEFEQPKGKSFTYVRGWGFGRHVWALGIGKWEESSIVSGPKKLTFLSGNIITTPCYILEQGEEREWGRKILPFYRLQLRHLTAFDKIKWDNHVSGSFTIGIMRKCISFFFFILINIIILFTDFISFSHVFFLVCSWKF